MKSKFLAHIRSSDKTEQSLAEHLLGVGEKSGIFADKIGLKSVGELLGLLHDFGKYSVAFQNYIKSAEGLIDPDADDYVESADLRGKIDHSTAGAQQIWNNLKNFGKAGQGKLCGQILALCIASHHSGLIDCFNLDGDPVFINRMKKKDEKTHLLECQKSVDEEIQHKIANLSGKSIVQELFESVKKMVDLSSFPHKELSKIEVFHLGFFVRFLFSCLIDADRLDSAEFENPARLKERIDSINVFKWEAAISKIEGFVEDLKPQNQVDKQRQKISNICKEKASGPQGVYTLTVPTGGGKTYSSLRYALHHAKIHSLDRIIYIIPYTSIIEQNAEAIRKILDSDSEKRSWVLEQHSNLEPENQTWRSKLISENWDSPIVLTTMVQFLETLFSGGTRGVRRLHQLSKSVLIFDEIQTLPVNCVHLFCNALNFLTAHCKTTAVLCTATQPLLNELKSPHLGQLSIPKANELAGDTSKLFYNLNRVDIYYRCKPGGWQAIEIAGLAVENLNKQNSCLVIVNTKAWAQILYQECEALVDPSALFHLSTNLYPAHRKILLNQIRERLNSSLPVLCISTQLIEAGVDIDFSSVVRFLAGLDSIAQAAGRCNRNGILKDAEGNDIKGQVYVINPHEETIDSLPDIKVGRDVADRLFSENHQDWLAPKTIKRYFQYYFFDRAKDMAYNLSNKELGRDDSILNLLSDNPLCNGKYTDRPGKLPLLNQSFMEAGRLFRAIDAPSQAVIVQHGGGKELVAELCAVAKEFDAKRYYELLKQAQKYSVNVYPNVWKKLLDSESVHETQQGHGIYYLREEHYNENFGLTVDPKGEQSLLNA